MQMYVDMTGDRYFLSVYVTKKALSLYKLQRVRTLKQFLGPLESHENFNAAVPELSKHGVSDWRKI